MGQYKNIGFKRPVFSPRSPAPPTADTILGSEISSLPDLIRFNARENPHHIFALQSELKSATRAGGEEDSYGVSQITFEQLDAMVRACVDWIRKVITSSDQDADSSEQSPVALYVESGVGLFVYLAALLSMDIPALLISARLSCPSVLHLLNNTNAKTILISRRTGLSLSEDINNLAQVVVVEPYSAFMACNRQEDNFRNSELRRSSGSRSALILHSSGTTGLPKPILLSHRYILGYAACHQFADDEAIDWVNFSTLPLYHGFGLLAPCLSLSVGMTVCFPPPSIIPATKSTVDLIRTFNCRSLMTVPSIIDDILSQTVEEERSEALGLLAKLEFLAVGGGALKSEQGAILAKHDIKLLNHYGVTEIGAIAPIFRPKSDYNWRYLRLRSDLGLELHPIPNSKHFKLIGYPIGWGKPFEVQDELERNDTSSHVEVRILGRTDDVIVLKTGEKIQPRQLEDALNADAAIRTAVCIGSGFFELAVIIDPRNEDTDPETTKSYVWSLLSNINPSVDQHARIMSRKAVIVKPKGKSIPRSDKGSVMRQRVYDIFKEEINDAYAAMELDSLGEGFLLDPTDMETGIRHLITVVTGNRLDGGRMRIEDDFFDSGMDSLQTVHLSRVLASSLQRFRKEDEMGTRHISADFIYRSPSIKKLAAKIAHFIHEEKEPTSDEDVDRTQRLRALADEFISGLDEKAALPPAEHIILVTGSTGTLGAHAVAQLTRIKSVSKVICLVRCQRPVSSGTNGTSDGMETQSILLHRQQGALATAGIRLEPAEWAKIELVELASIVGENNTSEAQLSYLSKRVTHILHLAWPMDFQRRVESFRPHIRLLQTLTKLAERAFAEQHLREPVRLLFSSSIAAIRYYGKGGDRLNAGSPGTMVPESAVDDPLASLPMGYAEAKWICEMYLNRTSKHQSGVDPVVVRVGQLSGPEKTSGVWSIEEHMPTLVRASQKIGAFPELKGVASWIPVDRAACSLIEMLVKRGRIGSFLHLENPVRQPLKDIFTIMAHEMHLQRPFMIPFEQWLQRATKAGEIRSLESFYKDHFQDLSGGAITLDTTRARAVSNCLMSSSAISKDLIIDYINRWRREGFLE
ncbi:hypothetical protein F4777DRAFT_593123 [Nemania sp. FL0916]|nr:hypothetical protein F4777DRAFT_593123 [Nemania sp. FL0916]